MNNEDYLKYVAVEMGTQNLVYGYPLKLRNLWYIVKDDCLAGFDKITEYAEVSEYVIKEEHFIRVIPETIQKKRKFAKNDSCK